MSRVLGVDQGTTGTTAVLLEDDGHVEPLPTLEHAQLRPREGWVEHDAGQLLDAIGRLVEAPQARGAQAIGIANQGETVVAWDATTGRPIYNAIVWQDTRTRERVDTLRTQGYESVVRERAGLPLDPYFSATKLHWLLEHVHDAKSLLVRGRLRLGTTDAFFLDRLTGTYATDVTTASRTSLMNIHTRQWDPVLCELFGVPLEVLPPIRPTAAPFGAVRRRGDPRELPVTASVVDQQAALFGHGCREPGLAKVTFGTGAFVLAVTGDAPCGDGRDGPLPTVAWWLPGAAPTYALDGGVYTAGAALDWARSAGWFDAFGELAGFSGPPAVERGLVFVPALAGLGCPYWDPSAAGLLLGVGQQTSRGDLCRAVLEGVALRAAQVLRAVELAGGAVRRVSIDGGMSKNDWFCQLVADATGHPVEVASFAEFTALGVAQLALAGAHPGRAPEELPGTPPPRLRLDPLGSISPEGHARFARAVERARSWR